MSLSIFRIEKRKPNAFFAIKTAIQCLYKRFFGAKIYDIIVLEYGIDRPKEMEFLLSITKPHIGVLTKLDAVHSLQFWDPQAIATEEVKMLLETKDVVYINSDDIYGRQITEDLDIDYFFYRTTSKKEETIEHTIDFGESTLSLDSKGLPQSSFTARVHDLDFSITTNLLEKQNYGYIAMSLSIADLCLFKITGKSLFDTLTKQQDKKHTSNKKNSIALTYELQPWRFSLFSWKQDSIIIDSSYNCAPQSIRKALENIYRLRRELYPDHRIITVFGEMRELGDFEEREHRLIAPVLSHISDTVFLVGNATQYTVDELQKMGISTKEYSHYIKASNALEAVKNYIKNNSNKKHLILCKGSQNTIFLEEVVKGLLKHSSNTKKLVRQSAQRMKQKQSFFDTEHEKSR